MRFSIDCTFWIRAIKTGTKVKKKLILVEFQGEMYKVPYVGGIAEKQLAKMS